MKSGKRNDVRLLNEAGVLREAAVAGVGCSRQQLGLLRLRLSNGRRVLLEVAEHLLLCGQDAFEVAHLEQRKGHWEQQLERDGGYRRGWCQWRRGVLVWDRLF